MTRWLSGPLWGTLLLLGCGGGGTGEVHGTPNLGMRGTATVVP